MKIATSALALFAAVSPLAAAQGSFNDITADSLSVQDGAAQSLEQIAITSDVAAQDEDAVILYASESSDLPVLGIGAAHVDCEGASKDIMIKRSAREDEEEEHSSGEDSGSGRGRKGGSDDANETETETESATATQDVAPAEGTMHTMSPSNGTEVEGPAASSSDNPTITAAPIAHKGPSADDGGDDDDDDSSTTERVTTKDDKPTRASRTRSTLTTTVRNATRTTKAGQPTSSSSDKGRGRKGKGRGRKGKGKGRGRGKADDSSSNGKHKGQGRGKQKSD
ncbi:hypothetical protein C1H76_7865 [Elsinoe australis]|uniref:Uncharacterized protein n=1 Tax=Elsinoe australis TaxID=40998 RepID=A0A4U7ATS8_9PEZI|nr:hypothetical protein C1H76_7865 [Elsinoe australis]